MKKEHLKTVRVRNPASTFLVTQITFPQKLNISDNYILTWRECNERRFNVLLISLLLKVPILAKRVPSSRERSQVSSDHEEPGAKIRDPGAEEGGERGRHGGRRQRDKERHLRLQVRDDWDHEGLGDEHPGRLWRIRWGIVCILERHFFHFSPGPGGKKNRQKERRLMKGFNLATGGSAGSGGPDSNLQIKFSGAWWPFKIWNNMKPVQILSNYILNNFITLWKD